MEQARFDLFRVSLFERKQKDLFINYDETKYQYLIRVFRERIEFCIGGTDLTYLLVGEAGESGIIGRIGCNYKLEENRPPDEGFEDSTHEGHKAAFIVIDLKDGVDGQKIAMQRVGKVGRPANVMNALAKKINDVFFDSKYLIEIAPISDGGTFWKFVEENGRKITYLRIDFIAPNGIWTTSQTAREEVARARDVLNAQTTSLIARNPDGLNVENDDVRGAVEYASTGSGSVKATAKNGKKYDSVDKIKKTNINLPRQKKLSIEEIAENYLGILGHE